MSQRIATVKADPAYIRSELAIRNLNTDILAALAGKDGRASINHYLSKGCVTTDVADVLRRLEIDLERP